ncbi:type I-C CRISPR-associated protein Cas8c/Csd1 [Methanofollis aquaemaris]|uniref:Type I-C CRISPR-associated protein Cas8c/Csd1 n=1 Tax=Methanofollis aquaemaris TaxID=126734 RepID=A0A8A3S9A3_9EURY|nr:type I-C CRISPR-associated protein Cas8c/Csd1 [Methanofollis aquaemaris]QSZ68076.1 type I-C CRISPR-associated protein Cas8c/Csd1 [Methanofollis aquaemaris]
MIIQALCRYYDILERDESVKIARPGYSRAPVSFALVLSDDGEMTHIVDLRSDDKKPRPQEMDVPLQPSRANSIAPYFACDNAKYVFGVEKLKIKEFEKKFAKNAANGDSQDALVLEKDDKEVVLISQRSRDCFEAFKALHHEVLDGLDDAGVRSFLKFLDGWDPASFLGHPKVLRYKDEILNGGSFVFECGGGYLHRNGAIRRAWEGHFSNENDGDGSAAQCLVSGDVEPIARLHQKIKGVVGAQTAGASLVSFNDRAFESYGKDQSYNAPVGETSMFKYTTALNHLLAHQENRMGIADTTTVFWAETQDRTCEDLARFLMNPREEEAVPENDEPADGARVRDKKTRKLVGDILKKVRSGQKINQADIHTDPETNFYILGLSPNNARLAVRFWYMDSFGNFVDRVGRHHLDMEIIKGDFSPKYVSISRLLKATLPKGSKDQKSQPKTVQKVSPLLGGLVMNAILKNQPYPVQMYGAVLNRVKVGRSIDAVQAGFIKAYLLRMCRAGGTKLQEDLITVSLNEESPDVPYRLGRLFAVLEKAQNDTNGEMKSTINSKYFSSASSTPAVVFPVLLKLAQHHIAKSEWGFKSNKSIEEILSGVDGFPAYLNLEEQGMFMLGYYHQRKAFFQKKEETPVEEAKS